MHAHVVCMSKRTELVWQRSAKGCGWAGWARERKVRENGLLSNPIREEEAASQVSTRADILDKQAH